MISDELIKEILDQLSKNQRASEYTFRAIIVCMVIFGIQKIIEYCINRQNTKNEKKGDEELYISQKQYDMEVDIFLKFTEERYILQCVLKKIAQNKGKLDRGRKETCENDYKDLIKVYNNLTEYLNKYICFVPLDIWRNMMDYTDSVRTVIEEWNIIFQSGLKVVLVTDKIQEELENIEEKSNKVSDCIREYIYRERVILN